MNLAEGAFAISSVAGAIVAVVNCWLSVRACSTLRQRNINGLALWMARWNVEGAAAWMVVHGILLLLSWRLLVLPDAVRVFPDSYLVWPPNAVDQALVLSAATTAWLLRQMWLRSRAMRLAGDE